MSADFDKAIDRAVREMLDVEPPAGLRRRVLEQIPASGTFRWKILLPVTAAALLILALLLPRSTPRQPETTTSGLPRTWRRGAACWIHSNCWISSPR